MRSYGSAHYEGIVADERRTTLFENVIVRTGYFIAFVSLAVILWTRLRP
jgi:hypothetical protein